MRQILKAPNIDTSLALNYTYIYSHVPRNDPVSLQSRGSLKNVPGLTTFRGNHLIVQAAFSVFISLFAASFDDGVFYNNGYLSK